MIDGLKPYGEMKESGATWLGPVPRHWRVLPNRALFKEISERDHPEADMLSVTIAKGVIRQKSLLEDSSKKDSSKVDKSAYKLVQPGDIAYNKMRAWQGAVGVSDLRGIVSPAYVVQRPNPHASPRFLHYLLRTPAFAKEAERWSYGITSDMWSLRPEHFRQIYSCLPPPDEQTAIVRFLDHADRRIRRAIAAKQKLIRLLEEQKRAIIHRAVTRGVDLDVRLKPSGIEWLGDVPEHWNFRQLRRLISMVTSGSRGWASYYADDGSIFLQSGNLGRSMRLKLENVQHVALPRGAEGERTKVAQNDILVCITGALTGNVALVDLEFDKPAFVNQHIALVRPVMDVVYPKFLAMVLHSEVGKSQFKISEYGGTKQGLSLNDVKSLLVPVPSIDEQESICGHVDEATSEIVSAITKAEAEILLIREYRVRLVADVVTGKLDVREAATKLSEVIESGDTEFDAEEESEDDSTEEIAAEDQAA